MEEAYFNYVYQPYLEADETISGVTVIAHDVTEQVYNKKQHTEALETAVLNRTNELLTANNELKRKSKEIKIAHAKLALNHARSLIEASLDPLITINTEGVVTDINEAFATITGEKREKLLGTDFGNYFTEPEKARKVYKEVFDKGFVKNYGLTLKDHKQVDVLFYLMGQCIKTIRATSSGQSLSHGMLRS